MPGTSRLAQTALQVVKTGPKNNQKKQEKKEIKKNENALQIAFPPADGFLFDLVPQGARIRHGMWLGASGWKGMIRVCL